MENRKTEGTASRSARMSGDSAARFLRELRQLRSRAGLGHAELAARSHYPYDHIRAAEAGPALPDLPVLSAYVRGCGGTIDEWEERWRALRGSPAVPLLATRPARYSAAAAAGTRPGSGGGSTRPEAVSPDPSGAMTAASGRIADNMAAGQSAETGPAATGTTAAGTTGTMTAAGTAATTGTAAAETGATGTTIEASTVPTGGVTEGSAKRPMRQRLKVAALCALAICVVAVVLAAFA